MKVRDINNTSVSNSKVIADAAEDTQPEIK